MKLILFVKHMVGRIKCGMFEAMALENYENETWLIPTNRVCVCIGFALRLIGPISIILRSEQ
jgi:hypothetical protein